MAIQGFGNEVQTIISGERQGAWLHRKDGLLLELLDGNAVAGRAKDIGRFSGRFSLYDRGLVYATGGEIRCFDTSSMEVTQLLSLPGIVVRHMAEAKTVSFGSAPTGTVSSAGTLTGPSKVGPWRRASLTLIWAGFTHPEQTVACSSTRTQA